METEIFAQYGLEPLEPLADDGRISMWKMSQPAISRTVLAHVFSKALADDAESSKYVFSVVRALSNCAGPALGQVYTIYDEPGFKAVISEYVEGLSLDKTVRALGPLSVKQVVRTGLALAETLSELWETTHIVHGGVKPEYVTLDAGSTAKLVSPCFARTAPADVAVPVADMADLGSLMFFLATGVRPGQAHSVKLPRALLSVMERLSSDSPMSRFASWGAAINELKALESGPDVVDPPLKPPARGSVATGPSGKTLSVKKPQPGGKTLTFKAPSGAVPKVVKASTPAVGGEKPKVAVAKRNSLEAIRKASAASRKAARSRIEGGSGGRFLAMVALLLVVLSVFVLRVGFLELNERMCAGGMQMSASEPELAASALEPPDAGAETPEEAAALNRYLAAHVGGLIPLLYDGQTRQVTLVSYDVATVTVRIRKSLTIRRSDISSAQRAMWR